jgi:LacI family transcriptional regulator
MPKKGSGAKNKKRSMATIYDVAAHAKVSKTTVSRVVNGEASVSIETRARVHRAIKALHYIPNKAARSLASQAEVRIGLLYNNPSVAYFSELLIGALEGSGRNGAQLVVDKCDVGNPVIARKAALDLVKTGLNGMLLTAPLSGSAELIRELTEEGVSIVGLATGRFRSDISCVGIDDYLAAYEMTGYLIGLGHRRIGFVKGHPNHTSSQQRFLGFKAALRDAGAGIAPSVVVQGFNSYRSGLDAADALFESRGKVTAVFASNDEMASAVLSVAHRKGMVVPQDLSIVGFDDTVASSTWPMLTTVRQPISEIAAKAIETIVKNCRLMRAGTRVKPQNFLISHSLVLRESAAAPPPG